MDSQFTRRRMLQLLGGAGAAAGVGALSGRTTQTASVDVRGAMYIPARAFNTYQMWEGYDPEIVERDFGYARRVNLNAIRTWLSYELWEEDPDELERNIDHFLAAAEDRDIGIVLGLFEALGKEPTRRNLENTNPLTAPPVQTPSEEVMHDSDEWAGPREFIEWFMERYRDDDRLLAIELINEPGWWEEKRRFTKAMFETLAKERGSAPLTIGATSLANSAEYMHPDLDIIQFHYNFPRSRERYRVALQQGVDVAESVDRDVWLTEWQRLKPGHGVPESELSVEHFQPDYSSVAPVIADTGLGNFFWSLMVKPAYTLFQREQGVVNGLFHEDGAVWSLDDARAIKAMSGDPAYDGEERAEWPEWASAVRDSAVERYSR